MAFSARHRYPGQAGGCGSGKPPKKAPVIVVMETANALDISPFLEHPRVGALVHAGVFADSPGVADILFGDRVPAGRTIQTVYDSAWQWSISSLDMTMRLGPSLFPRPDCTEPHAAQCPNATNQGRMSQDILPSLFPIASLSKLLKQTMFRF